MEMAVRSQHNHYRVNIWNAIMIRNFAHNDAELTWAGHRSRKLPAEVDQPARRKLRMLDAATSLGDLTNPSGNRLHALHGDRSGQHSIFH